MITRTYSSTITSTGHLVAAVLCAAVLDVLLLTFAGPAWWPVGGGVSVLIVAVGLYQAVVSLVVGPDVIIVGRGPWRWPGRQIPTTAVVSARTATISWPQVFGIGAAFHWRTTRLTVRPGPTLCLQLDGGEHLWISTSHPDTARALLHRAALPGDHTTTPTQGDAHD